MILGGTFSYTGSFTVSSCDDGAVVIKSISPLSAERKLELREIPAFIEYMENNYKFQFSERLYITLDDRWRAVLLADLRSHLNRMEASA